MKLYYSPGACSLSPHIVLREAGLPFELQRVDTRSKQLKGGGDFTEINDKGMVPALQLDDGSVLTEGPAIVQFLADQKPETGLVPKAGTMERYRLAEWLNFISTELHKGFTPLFNPATPEEYKLMVREALAKRFGLVQKRLEGKTWAMGDQFTVADAYLFTVLSWTKFVGVDLSPWPVLVAYLERVAARPTVTEALVAEGLVKKS
ncbi:Glutathione S-transferase [Minicystis rosea]|nr:Glutathione S-transferase [Minicystis rosea]